MKRFCYAQLLSFGIVLLLISACAPITPVASSGATPAATAAPNGQATAAPIAEATEAVAGEATAAPSDAEKAATDAATKALADKLQVDAGTITVVSTKAVEWRDSCLGVQDPNTMCTQVITPGYVVVLSAGGQQYQYHTNDDGSSVVLSPNS